MSQYLITIDSVTGQVTGNVYGAGSAVPASGGSTTPPTNGGSVAPPANGRTVTMPMPWAKASNVDYSSNYGGLTPSDLLVVKFTTPNTPTNSQLCRLAISEYQAPPLPRNGVLTSDPVGQAPVPSGGGSVAMGGTTATFTFSVANTQPTAGGFYPSLALNTTYYAIIKTTPDESGTNNANVIVSLNLYNNAPQQ